MTRGRSVARLVNQVVCREKNEPWPWTAGSCAPHRAIRRELRGAAIEEDLTIAPSRNGVKQFVSQQDFPGHHISAAFERRAALDTARGPAERVDA